MPHETDASLAATFTAKCEEARLLLRKHMEARGLFEKDGWRINESIRHRQGRTELVMRPIHLRLNAPTGLECVVGIDEPGHTITADCET